MLHLWMRQHKITFKLQFGIYYWAHWTGPIWNQQILLLYVLNLDFPNNNIDSISICQDIYKCVDKTWMSREFQLLSNNKIHIERM